MTIATTNTEAAVADSYRKEIVFDRETRDYAMYLDGEFIGYARSYSEAEGKLNALVYTLLGDK